MSARHPRRHCRGRIDERGSVTAELVLLTPLLIVILLFVVALGRLAGARIDVDGAAAEAARAASIARDPATASAMAQQTATSALDSDHVTCAQLTVNTDTAQFAPGGSVAVTVTCTVGLSDLTGLRLPTSESVTSTATSVIDTYRERGMTATIQRLRSHVGEEDGMVTAFVVIFTFALLLMAGLVLDGGLTLAAKVQAIDDAQAAARAGAQAIDIATFRASGQITLDPAEATADAQRYLAASGHTGTVVVNGDHLTVTVSITQSMQILSLAGIDHLTVTGSGTATAEQADNQVAAGP